jgi:hypothetical protein
MAKTTQEKLLDSFMEAAGGEGTDALAAPSETRELAALLAETASQSSGAGEAGASSGALPAFESGMAPGPAKTEPEAASKTTNSGGGVTAGSVAKTVLESGLGLIPLIGGLIGLFSGGGSESPAPLTKYVMPPSLDFQAADSGGALTSVSYDQMGTARSLGGSSTSAGGSAGSVSSGAGAVATPAQTTANAQTLDARWFMDHSADIAAAVRNAMLNSNSINDVVNDL